MFTRFITLLFMLSFAFSADADRCRDGEGGARNQHRGGGHHNRWQIPEEEASRVNPTPVSEGSLANGKTIFQTNCQRCHGEHGVGDGPDAAGLAVRPHNLRRATRHHSDGELAWMIRTGRDPMPSWQDILTPEQLWDVINYLRFEIGGGKAGRHGGRGGNRGRGGTDQGMSYGDRDEKSERCEMWTTEKAGDEPDHRGQQDGALELSAEIRDLLIEEMKAVGQGMQSLVVPLVTFDWAKIREIGADLQDTYILKQKLTREQMHELHQALPRKFQELDQEFHRIAGRVTYAAEKKDIDLVIKYVHRMNRLCIACHQRYAVDRFEDRHTGKTQSED